MAFKWIRDRPARWDADKQRIIGSAPAGIFDARFSRLSEGESLHSQWWRVVEDGKTLGFGWLDIVWGDAEVVIATAPEARGRGVGTFALEQLEHEAHHQGLMYLYNTVRPHHPDRDAVTRWFAARGFEASSDGALMRTVTTHTPTEALAERAAKGEG